MTRRRLVVLAALAASGLVGGWLLAVLVHRDSAHGPPTPVLTETTTLPAEP